MKNWIVAVVVILLLASNVALFLKVRKVSAERDTAVAPQTELLSCQLRICEGQLDAHKIDASYAVCEAK